MNTTKLASKVNMRLFQGLVTKTPIKLLGGLALGAVLIAGMALQFTPDSADGPARPLSSEKTEAYPDWAMFDTAPAPALATGAAVSSVPFEYWPEAGFDSFTYHRFMVEQSKKVYAQINFLEEWLYTAIPPVSSTGVTATIADPLAGDGFDALPDPALAAGSLLDSQQGACYPLYPELGPCASEFVAVTPTTVDRYDRGLFDEVPVHSEVVVGLVGSPLASVQFEYWPEVGFDSYTYHRFMVEQGKVGRVLSGTVANPSAIDPNEVWPEIEDTPIQHLMKQLKAGS
jgi:hypothetical protein